MRDKCFDSVLAFDYQYSNILIQTTEIKILEIRPVFRISTLVRTTKLVRHPIKIELFRFSGTERVSGRERVKQNQK